MSELQKENDLITKKYARVKKDLAKSDESLRTERAQRESSAQTNTSRRTEGPRRRLVTIPDPPYLSDRKEPTFREQEKKIRVKLTVESDSFTDG